MSTQGGVGQDHVCAIIADFLMSTNVWWAIRYTCAYKFTARVKSRAEGMRKMSPFRVKKMADYCAVEVWERYSYLRNEAIIRKTPN